MIGFIMMETIVKIYLNSVLLIFQIIIPEILLH